MSLKLLYPGYDIRMEYRGHLLISGIADMGAERCFKTVLQDFMADPGPVFLIMGGSERISKETLRSCAMSRGFRLQDMTWDARGSLPFDLLSAADSAPDKAALMTWFLLQDTDSSSSHDMAQRFLRDAILACSLSGEPVRFRNVLRWDPDMVLEVIRHSEELSERFRREEEIFLTMDAVSSCWTELNTRISLLGREVADMLSGDLPARVRFAPGTLTLLRSPSGDPMEDREARRFFRGLAELLLKLTKGMNRREEKWHIAVYNGGNLSPSVLDQFMELSDDARHIRVPLCLYQEHIPKLLSVHGENIPGRFGCYAVFCTNDGTFWSSVFGSSLRPEITHSFDSGKTAAQRMRGGVVAHPGGKKSTMTLARVEKPYYEARAFSDLRENTFLWYLVRERRRGQKKMEVI